MAHFPAYLVEIKILIQNIFPGNLTLLAMYLSAQMGFRNWRKKFDQRGNIF